jgi:hypothetical protein
MDLLRNRTSKNSETFPRCLFYDSNVIRRILGYVHDEISTSATFLESDSPTTIPSETKADTVVVTTTATIAATPRKSKKELVEPVLFSNGTNLLLFSICDSCHWTLAVANINKRSFEYYDSLDMGAGATWIGILRTYFSKLSEKYQLHENFDAWPSVYYDKDVIPKQEDGVSCGVFVCKYMECISRGLEPWKFGFEQSDIPEIRCTMALELLTQRMSIGWSEPPNKIELKNC